MEGHNIRVAAGIPVLRRITVSLLEEVVEVHPVNGSVGLPLQTLIAPKILAPVAISAAKLSEVEVTGLEEALKRKKCILREDLKGAMHPVLAVVKVDLRVQF